MTRTLLVIAIAASLWPVASIGYGFASVRESAHIGRELDTATFSALHRRTSRLIRRLDASTSLRGVPDRRLARSAASLTTSWRRWRHHNAGLDTAASRVALRNQQVVMRMHAYTRAPSHNRLGDLNRAVHVYNHEVDRLQR